LFGVFGRRRTGSLYVQGAQLESLALRRKLPFRYYKLVIGYLSPVIDYNYKKTTCNRLHTKRRTFARQLYLARKTQTLREHGEGKQKWEKSAFIGSDFYE
jgi:hypothetical protein